MKAHIKKRWIKALRSDEYVQGTGSLVHPKGGYDAFCCLGVLCDVLGEEFSKTVSGLGIAINSSGFNTGRLPWRLLNRVSMSEGEQQYLIYMNDTGKSFKQIANYIETAL